MNPATSESPTPGRRRICRYSAPVLITVVAFHLLFGGIAAFWVVSRHSAGRKLTFNAGPKSPNPSERALEHRVQLQKKMQSTSAPPAVPQRILTTGLAAVTLPPLPDIKTTESEPRALMGAGGTGVSFATNSANSLGGDGGGSGTAINFFGIRDISTSVVIMIDVSDSMFTRTGDASGRKLVRHGRDQQFQVIREEAIQLVQGLTPATQFGIVHWGGGAYSWKPALQSATEENKQAATAHIQGEIDFQTAKPRSGERGGTRHDLALKEAFALKPQTIYMLTDGNATESQSHGGLKPIPPQDIYRVAEAGQKGLTRKAHLHVIYYVNGKEKSEEVAMLRGLASRNGGQFKKVKAKGGGHAAR